ncbi:Sulfate transporter 3.1, partial [Cucurbita argyrosperma subsp. argyrosperma]
MGNSDYVYPSTATEGGGGECLHRAAIPPPQPFVKSLKNSLKETFFPDDPLRQFKNQPAARKVLLGLQYFFPVLEWGPRYRLALLKSDLISGITIASLAIPQGISYAKFQFYSAADLCNDGKLQGLGRRNRGGSVASH